MRASLVVGSSFGVILFAVSLVGSLGGCDAPAEDASDNASAAAAPASSSGGLTIEGDYDAVGFTGTAEALKLEVRDQLKYGLRQLGKQRVAAKLGARSSFGAKFTSFETDGGGKAHYVVTLDGAWANAKDELRVVLPRSRDAVVVRDHLACAPSIAGDTSRVPTFDLHFDPAAPGCAIPSHALVTATVKRAPGAKADASTLELAKFGTDRALRVVVLFDKDDRDASSIDAKDLGVAEFEKHLAALDARLAGAKRTEKTFVALEGSAAQNIVVTHVAKLASGVDVVVDSILTNPGRWGSYPALAAEPAIDVVIKNESPFAVQGVEPYADPFTLVDVTGSAVGSLPLFVAGARFSHAFGASAVASGRSVRVERTMSFGSDVPYGAQAALTKRVLDVLVGEAPTAATLLRAIEGVDPNLLPIVE